LPRSSAGVCGSSHGGRLHPEDLTERLLRYRQRLGQHGDVLQIRRHEIQVPLLIDDVFSHVAVCFLDAAFPEFAGVAVVLVPGSARPAAGMGTWAAYGRYD